MTATLAAVRAGGVAMGTSRGGYIAQAHAAAAGFPFVVTDEETAKRRTTNLYLDGERVNPGRGERLWDCCFVAEGFLVPFSLKGGDSRDVSTDIPLVRALVEAGQPIWVACLEAEHAEAVNFKSGDVEPARGLTMRRINITPVLARYINDWDSVGAPGVARIRAMKSNGHTYHRININWKKVPAEFWLDADYRDFDPTAPM